MGAPTITYNLSSRPSRSRHSVTWRPSNRECCWFHKPSHSNQKDACSDDGDDDAPRDPDAIGEHMNEKSRQESAEHSPDDVHPRPIFFPLQEFATDPPDPCTDDNAPKVSHEFILVVCVF